MGGGGGGLGRVPRVGLMVGTVQLAALFSPLGWCG